MKDKPVKYWIRTEIEEIIKEKSIDRKRFYEYSKTSYQKIITGSGIIRTAYSVL